MVSESHSTANVWKESVNVPTWSGRACTNGVFPEYPGPWIAELVMAGALPRGQLDARRDTARRDLHLAAGRDLRRRVAARPVVAPQAGAGGNGTGNDEQLPPSIERNVLGRGRVVFLLVVAPAAVPPSAPVRRVVAPLRRIDGCARRSIEFVAPHLDP